LQFGRMLQQGCGGPILPMQPQGAIDYRVRNGIGVDPARKNRFPIRDGAFSHTYPPGSSLSILIYIGRIDSYYVGYREIE
ncbi:hypothetical protein, partial [Sphingobium fuliginis]|uniref:hypothetical protein n=1 Tax=Sphingobium fuliginis (strain ATCC 27551) TaxID=336203 RepID=UPI0037C9181C